MTESIKKDLAYRLRREAREAYNLLDENFQLMYRTERCQMCSAHLTVRQLNRVILQGVPPVCLKDYKRLESDIEKLAPLFDQLRLF